LVGVAGALAACGRELALEPRAAIKTDDIGQSYTVTAYASDDGVSSYVVTATLFTSDGMRETPTALPAGDTLTLNGAALPAVAGGGYGVEGRDLPASFAFAWTHGGTTYANTVTVTAYPPSPVPTSVSKAAPAALELAGVPAGITVNAALNAGASIAEPYFALPVRVAGGGAAVAATPDLAALAEGPGIVTLDETQTQKLQAQTAAGGRLKTVVQYGYYVTIAP
jgi:hypothetical protein